MQAEPQVVREGWLVKAPSPNTNTWMKKFWDTKWKRRYFVLCSGHLPGESRLLWYHDEQQRRNNGKAKGSINLQHCEQVDSNLSLSYETKNKKISYTWIFDIRVSTQKGSVLYYFSAPSEQDMNEWVQLLCRLCHLEREDESDGSGSSFYVVGSAAQQRAGNHDRQPPNQNQNDNRYVEPPRGQTPQATAVPWTSGPVQQLENDRALPPSPSANRPQIPLPPPTQLNLVPPPAFISRPPAPLPQDAAPKAEESTTLVRALDKNQGYIPLKDCTSSPVEIVNAVAETSTRTRLNATSDLDPMLRPSPAGSDSIIADQPPSYPPPPLPNDDGVFQPPQQPQYLPPPPPHHSRSPSKDSTASSLHLSSTESEQGETRRPSLGKPPFGAANGLTLAEEEPSVLGACHGLPSNPTSPISPPGTINRPPRSSDGSSSVCYLTDDAASTITPPPRPPKTSRSSVSSQQKQPFMYENEPSPIRNCELSKFASYDKLTFRPGGMVNFDSLPRTTKSFASSANGGRLNSPSAFSTLPKYSSFADHEKDYAVDESISASPKSFGQEFPSMDQYQQHHKSPATIARSLHDIADGSYRSRTVSSSSGMPDADSSYSPFTPGPPRLAPVLSLIRPGRSPSSDPDAGVEQYQNCSHPPARIADGNQPLSSTQGAPPVPERPPEVKRELKPRNRGPSLPGSISAGSMSSVSGVGPLPKMPNRLTDVKKGSPSSSSGGGGNGVYYNHHGNEKNENRDVPQFDVQRRISFKSRNVNFERQQMVPTMIGAVGNVIRTGTLDTEVKIEEEVQLDYIAIDTATSRVNAASPPGTPAMTTRRFTGGVARPSHSPSSLDHTIAAVKTAPGYVQIDPQATGALRKAQAAASAMRDSQQRTLENSVRNPPLHSTNGTGGTLSRKK